MSSKQKPEGKKIRITDGEQSTVQRSKNNKAINMLTSSLNQRVEDKQKAAVM